MNQPNQPPTITTDARYCCHCGKLTREPIVVARAFSSSGAGTAVYACPEHAHHYERNDGETSVSEEHRLTVEMPHVCFIRKPGDVIRCTEPPGHEGDHFDYLSGKTDSKGSRPGVRWPRREGETQFD